MRQRSALLSCHQPRHKLIAQYPKYLSKDSIELIHLNTDHNWGVVREKDNLSDDSLSSIG